MGIDAIIYTKETFEMHRSKFQILQRNNIKY